MNKFLFDNALRFRISRHIVFFTVVVLVFTLVLYSRNSEKTFLYQLNLTFINALIFLGYGYLTIFILIPFLVLRRKYAWFAVSFLALGFVLSAIKLSVSDYIFYSAISPEFIGSKGMFSVRFILVNTKDMSFIVALFVIARFSKDWLIAEKQHKILQKKYAELNLKLLQNHFEPHFLFNTLNNLYALSLRNFDETLDLICRLKRVLHFAIVDGQQEKVLLNNEIAMIQDYIRIELLRYGSRLQLINNVKGEISQQVIAPFVLFTLVENCFKHGSSTDAGNPWIELNLNCKKNRLSVETKNSMPKKIQLVHATENKGLVRLRQRLDLIYPKKYSLVVQPKEQEFTVKLDLDLS